MMEHRYLIKFFGSTSQFFNIILHAQNFGVRVRVVAMVKGMPILHLK
jgi:hypothetical protein